MNSVRLNSVRQEVRLTEDEEEEEGEEEEQEEEEEEWDGLSKN